MIDRRAACVRAAGGGTGRETEGVSSCWASLAVGYLRATGKNVLLIDALSRDAAAGASVASFFGVPFGVRASLADTLENHVVKLVLGFSETDFMFLEIHQVE